MSPHEIQIHVNTSATADEAPCLGNYVAKATTEFKDYVNDISKDCGLPPIAVLAILEGSFAELAALERVCPVRVNTEIGQLHAIITGSFPTADAAFDRGRNALELAIRLDDGIRNALLGVKPSITTGDAVVRIRVDSIADTEIERPQNVIYGTRAFTVTGKNLVMTDEDAEIHLTDAAGAVHPCTVLEPFSKQRFKARADTSNPSGDYKLVVKSRGGDPDGPLQTSFRKVKCVHVEPPPVIPTITQVEQRDHLPACISFGTEDATLISGTNLERFDAARGDKLLWELWEDGVLKQTSDGTSDIVAVDPVIACPRGVNLEPQLDPNDWHGHSGKVAVVINGQRADFPVSYVI